MKKLLALLLAFMLPLSVLADDCTVSISVDAEKGPFVQFVHDAMMLAPNMDADTAAYDAALLQSVLDGMSLVISVKDHAIAMNLLVNDQLLIDLVAYDTERGVYLTSSMLPDYALFAAEPATSEEPAATEQIDWSSVFISTYPAVESWLSDIESQQVCGVFVGDAYEGGTKCTTWTVNDADIATLFNALLNEDVCHAVKSMITASGLDGDTILKQLKDMNDKAANGNGKYILRIIQDDENQLVGASLVVCQNNEQVASASLGANEAGLRLVLGLGLKQENYWGEFTVEADMQQEDLILSGSNREWVSSKAVAFSGISAESEPLFAYDWRCLLSVMDQDALTCEFDIIQQQASALHVLLTADNSADVPYMDASLKICSIDDPYDREQYEALLKQFLATLMARVVKIIPVELMLDIEPITFE